jgi:signal transduction histidine kinase
MLLLIVLALAPALALSAAGFEAQRAAAVERIHGETVRLAHLAGVAEASTLSSSRQVLESLVWLAYLDPSEKAVCEAAVRQANASTPQLSGIALLAADGLVRCSSNPVPAGFSVANTTSFVAATTSGRFAMGEYRVNRLTGEPTVGLMLPVVDSTGALVGVVGGTLDLRWTSQLLTVDLPPDYSLVLWDRTGVILARQPDHERWVGKPFTSTVVSAGLAAPDTAVDDRGLDGVRRMFATVPLAGVAGDPAQAYLSVGAPVDEALGAIDARFQGDLLVLIGVACLAFALTWAASERWVLRPLRALDAASRRLAAGDLAARTGVAHDASEVGQVARAFDDMAVSLESSLAREQAARTELEGANARLSELDRFRRDFVNQAAHELNNPLTPIALQAELLSNGHGGPLSPAQQRSLAAIRRNVARLARLSQDILDAARIQSGRMSLAPQRVELGALVREAVLGQQERAAAAGISLGAATEPGLAVDADPMRVAQVLDNLLGNALKFTPAGGCVHVEAGMERGQVVVRVRDSGAGFAPEDGPRLFQPFSQLPGGRAAGGSGLGLHVCKGIVEQHGGTVAAESAGPGRGATFLFALPSAPPLTLDGRPLPGMPEAFPTVQGDRAR